MTQPPPENRASGRSEALRQALGVVDLAAKAAAAYERPDLGERLTSARRRIDDPSFHVLVVGEFKQGKSTLINALLNAPICPVDDDVATSRPTLVRYADEVEAHLLLAESDGEGPHATGRQEIPVTAIREHVTEAAADPSTTNIVSVEVGIPRRLLAGGLVLVDTPGVGGLGSMHSTTTIGALPMADAVLFVSDASQEFSGPELEFMQTARSMCPNLYCVLTKTDFYPAWRKILELNRQHLAARDIEATIQPVSSQLRQAAVEANDRDLNDESGFAPLVAHLQHVVTDAERLTIRATSSDVIAVADQLASQFESEKAVLEDPDAAARTVHGLEQARERTEQMRSQAARWQQTLTDGVQDLSADVDHDLRKRFRLVVRQADEAIDASDPAETWSEFEPWLYRRVAEDVTNNYAYLRFHVDRLIERVAEHFDLEREELTVGLEIENPTDVIRSTAVEAELEVKTMTVREKGMTTLRGGYIGTLMFTMLGSMAGLALGPVPIVVGLFMGRKALRDEKERQLTMRRQQAKNAHRRYTDEVSFAVGKDSRDTLRTVQRSLRDFYAARAEELNRSTSESLAAAQEAANSDQSSRTTRLRDVEAELERITSLRSKALVLAPDLRVGTA